MCRTVPTYYENTRSPKNVIDPPPCKRLQMAWLCRLISDNYNYKLCSMKTNVNDNNYQLQIHSYYLYLFSAMSFLIDNPYHR